MPWSASTVPSSSRLRRSQVAKKTKPKEKKMAKITKEQVLKYLVAAEHAAGRAGRLRPYNHSLRREWQGRVTEFNEAYVLVYSYGPEKV